MGTDRRSSVVSTDDDGATAETTSGVPTAETIASILRHLAGRRGRSGRIISLETVRSYTSALPAAFAGITHLG
jgi:integrase/recombinase XerC